ncbi:MAG: glutathione-regulated potassium-efflux system protein KefB, partial [Rhodospirillaceae bacterium]|nr:glutathione-regulated potassium-efflux system protein KefB [Rhodospirillaceae bacterium]
RSTALTLCQGGEFAFVILHLGVGSLLISSQTVDLLIVVVTVSMAATPLLFKLHDWLTGRLTKNVEPEYEREISEENQVIIAGFGRVGQVVGRILQARRIGFTALEKSADQVDFVRRFGNKVYYGDASRLELLRAAKADHAVVLVLAVGNVEASLEIARLVRKHFPGLEIHARARNRQHAYALMDLGVEHIMRETFFSSLEIGKEVLVDLGLSERESAETVESFRDHDVHRLFNQREMAGDLNRMAEDHRQWVKELEEMFDEDQKVVEAEQVRPRSD